jgi:hypothetical protein
VLAILLLLLGSPPSAEADGMLSQSATPSTATQPFSLSWTAGGANARGFGMAWSAEQGRFVPAITVRRAIVEDVSVGLRFRLIGGEEVGSELDADFLIRKEIGRFVVFANVAVGQGLGTRSDVDFEAAVFGGWLARPDVRCGFEARLQRELVDALHTADDLGRAADFTAGPSVAYVRGPLELRALAGWRRPRGTASAGPVLVAGGGLEF